jgi:hypothetical protein
MQNCILPILFFLSLSSFGLFAKADFTLPFKVGEKLDYDLSWGFLPVGQATMEVHSLEEVNGELCYLVRFSVRTNSFADRFYKVRTTIESTVSSDFKKSIRYRKFQEEGKTKRNISVNFDYKEKKANYYQDGSLISSISIPSEVFDPLSIAYFFRLNILESNQEIALPTCDGKSYREIVVRTGPSKKVSVPDGIFDAIETIPEMQNLRGVFKKSPNSVLRVWYSKDKHQIPVKISSKVVVGSFNAKLKMASGLK